MEIRPLTEAERKYTYTQSMQLMGQTGCIGHLRGDFDRTGTGFLPHGTTTGKSIRQRNLRKSLMMSSMPCVLKNTVFYRIVLP